MSHLVYDAFEEQLAIQRRSYTGQHSLGGDVRGGRLSPVGEVAVLHEVSGIH